jgi:hypothetical protein
MLSNRKVPGHKLIFEGQPGSLEHSKWRCECGNWGPVATPALGPYGNKTSKARIAQVTMAHGKHAASAKPGP